ncbi:MAG TPA: Gfo/Idh/MocA family oxidoreductase [Vicinamibacteria bacterium]|jgi:predicted dehydrogenase
MQRRHFLRSSGGAALALAGLGRHAEALADTRLRVGLIGCGWYGKSALFRLLQVAPAQVVSLCDVDRAMLEKTGQLVAGRQASKATPRLYGDYRRMLAERDLDLAIVSTPDHWHALPMIEAVKSGADVYVEKPISVDVVEGQAMLAAARKNGRVVQVGLQRRSTPHLVEAREEIVKAGKLGRIGQVEIYSYYGTRRGSAKPLPVPATLDWEFWSGPAPLLPYNDAVHPRGWRSFMAYGNGMVGDLCVHMFDMVRWMLELGMPKRISSSGGRIIDPGAGFDISDTQTATFDFGELQVVWNHRAWGNPPDPQYPWAATIFGDKGTLKASVMGYDFTPNEGAGAVHRDVRYELDQFPEDRTEEELEKHVAPALRAHMKNLLACRESREKPVSDIEQGHISSSACILANLSLRLGRTLAWDQERGLVIGDDEANRLLRRPYRAPWVHPEPAA